MSFDRSDTAIVFIDPQVDVLSKKGKNWGAVGASVTENKTVENMLLMPTERAKVNIRAAAEAGRRAGLIERIALHYRTWKAANAPPTNTCWEKICQRPPTRTPIMHIYWSGTAPTPTTG